MTRKPSKRRAPKAWTRKLQRLYNRLNHPSRPLSPAEKERLRLGIDYLRAAIESYGLLFPTTREASATPRKPTGFKMRRSRRT